MSAKEEKSLYIISNGPFMNIVRLLKGKFNFDLKK